jgi:hypothetical protein
LATSADSVVLVRRGVEPQTAPESTN